MVDGVTVDTSFICVLAAMNADGIQNLGPNVTLITLNTEGERW